MSSHTAPEPRPIDVEAFNAFEAAGWDKKAATYDRFFGQLTSRLVDPLLDAADRSGWLEPDDIERLATAAYLRGRDADTADWLGPIMTTSPVVPSSGPLAARSGWRLRCSSKERPPAVAAG
jgi:hypothetical protein